MAAGPEAERMRGALHREDLASALGHAVQWCAAASGSSRLDPLYYASWLSFELGRWREASDWLTLLLEASVTDQNPWYVDVALVMRAHAWLELGAVSRARVDVDAAEALVPPDEALTWLRRTPGLSLAALHDRLARVR